MGAPSGHIAKFLRIAVGVLQTIKPIMTTCVTGAVKRLDRAVSNPDEEYTDPSTQTPGRI